MIISLPLSWAVGVRESGNNGTAGALDKSRLFRFAARVSLSSSCPLSLTVLFRPTDKFKEQLLLHCRIVLFACDK